MTSRLTSSQQEALHALLVRAQALGFVGPGSVVGHINHAIEMINACEAAGAHGKLLDLGSGAGLPGLVIGAAWQSSVIVLLEVNQRRAAFLREAVQALDMRDHVSVLGKRAEESGRSTEYRAWFDMVVARGFGRPAVVAECAAPFLRRGGRLIVSEPPLPNAGADSVPRLSGSAALRLCGSAARWPATGLSLVGLRPVGVYGEKPGFQVLELDSDCPEKYPRRVGVPEKRPLF